MSSVPTWQRLLRRYATLLTFGVVLFGCLWLGRHVLLPFVLAIFLVYIVDPAVKRLAGYELKGRPVPRWVAVLAVYTALIGAVWIFSVTALPQLAGELAKLVRETPDFVARVRQVWVPALNEWLQEVLTSVLSREEGAGPILDLNAQLFGALQHAAEGALSHLDEAIQVGQTLVRGVVNAFVRTVLTLMIAAFLLIDLDRVHVFFRSLTVSPLAGERYDQLLGLLDRGLSGVIRGQLLICLVNGLLTFVGLWLLGVPFALILATVAGVLSLIPIFGTILSTVPAVAIGLTQSFATGMMVLGWILGIHFVEANFLNPKIIGTSARIHPVIVIFALLTGEHSFGLVGALLAVPFASMIQTVFLFVRELSAEEIEPAAEAEG